MDYDKTDVASRYAKGRAPLPESMEAWLQAIERHIRSSEIARVLDVGCGAGRFTAVLGERLDAVVVGLDPSQGMIRRVPRSPRGTSQLTVASAENLPLAVGVGDLAFMSMVYHHLDSTARALTELHSALREGGYLCIRNSLVECLDSFVHLRFFPAAREHLKRVLPTRSRIVDDVSREGFELLGEEMVSTVFTSSFATLQEKIHLRTQSELLAITDDEFREGARLMARAQPDFDSEPVDITSGLFVFRRIATE